jgi:hypothetical protein
MPATAAPAARASLLGVAPPSAQPLGRLRWPTTAVIYKVGRDDALTLANDTAYGLLVGVRWC